MNATGPCGFRFQTKRKRFISKDFEMQQNFVWTCTRKQMWRESTYLGSRVHVLVCFLLPPHKLLTRTGFFLNPDVKGGKSPRKSPQKNNYCETNHQKKEKPVFFSLLTLFFCPDLPEPGVFV